MGWLGLILDPVAKIIERVIPDKAAQDAAKAQLLTMQLQGDLDALTNQTRINMAEAQSQSVFVAGWRPFVGWGCGFAFVYSYILQPMIQTLLVAFHSNFDPAKLPVVNVSDMMPVLLGMLGLAAARTVEKVNGVQSGH